MNRQFFSTVAIYLTLPTAAARGFTALLIIQKDALPAFIIQGKHPLFILREWIAQRFHVIAYEEHMDRRDIVGYNPATLPSNF